MKKKIKSILSQRVKITHYNYPHLHHRQELQAIYLKAGQVHQDNHPKLKGREILQSAESPKNKSLLNRHLGFKRSKQVRKWPVNNPERMR